MATRTITIKVKRVTVLRVRSMGISKVLITFEDQTARPGMGYDTTSQVEVAPDHGVEWCRTVLGIEPDDVIDS